MKRMLQILGVSVLIPLLYVGVNLIYSTMNDFTPEAKEEVEVLNMQSAMPDSVIRLLTWNIGYAGLGAESDFFYDGGSTVRVSEALTRKNMEGVLNKLAGLDSVDILLLQEVDTFSKRSYWLNELGLIAEKLPQHSTSFALNYNVDFVPIPFLEPMGRVMGGLATYNRFVVNSAQRHQFPSSYNWPNRIYFLDRCFLEQRVPLSDGRELVVINTHNSAFDDGSLKAKEMGHLREYLLEEQRLGNPVIVGGDWNQGAPGTGFQEVSQDFLPDWQWVFDTSFATNRSLKAAYVKGETETFVIDYFLVSPDLVVEEVIVLNMDFSYSDHQPVFLQIRLRANGAKSF